MFRLNRNERSHWSGNGVHVESELVFMIGRNMQEKTDAGYRCVNALGFSDKPEPTEAAAIYWCVKCNGLNSADEDDELDVQWPDPLLSNEGAKQ